MSKESVLHKRTTRRAYRTKNKVKASNRSGRLRISVYRSLTGISAQIIDDKEQKTVLSASTKSVDGISGDKTAQARAVGVALGKQAVEKSITHVCFDRGRYLYHGRVKAFAEGLREGGLEF